MQAVRALLIYHDTAEKLHLYLLHPTQEQLDVLHAAEGAYTNEDNTPEQDDALGKISMAVADPKYVEDYEAHEGWACGMWLECEVQLSQSKNVLPVQMVFHCGFNNG